MKKGGKSKEKIVKRLNRKSKKEQVFLLLMMTIFVFGFMCVTGCGGSKKSCEKVKFSKKSEEDINFAGVSIPGCGGCLSSGRGCNSCLWAQSYKLSAACNEKSEELEGEEEETSNNYKVAGCHTTYYADSCGGCSQEEKHIYVGFLSANMKGEEMTGAFYTSPDGDESLLGYYNGCGGCINSHGYGATMMEELEEAEDID